MTLLHWFVRALPMALLCSTIARAQETPPLATGTKVLAVVRLDAGARDPVRCESSVVQSVGDTLLLSRVGTCPLGTYNGEVSPLLIDHGSRWKHVAIGFASGAAIGGIAARLAAGDGCAADPCDDGDLAVGLMTIGGIVVGAASGLLIGAAIPAGVDWGTPRAVRVLRVGSVTLRPEIRLARRTRANNYQPAR